MNTTREISLIVSQHEARGLALGTITQLRRPVKKFIGPDIDPERLRVCRPMRRGRYTFMGNPDTNPPTEISVKPIAFPGDMLLCKERWYSRCGEVSEDHIACIKFVATDDEQLQRSMNANPGLRNPAHLPPWAVRFRPTVLTVRVERIQDVTEADAQSCGIERLNLSSGVLTVGGESFRVHPLTSTYVEAFKSRWDAQYGKSFPWASNPFVWVAALSPAKEAR